MDILEEKEILFDDKEKMYKYLARVFPIRRVFKVEQFKTAEQLYSSWPQFRPENIHDFTQERGGFTGTMSNSFFWVNQEGRYYLDPITFDLIGASLGSNRRSKNNHELDFGYTDLVLTAEAIKNKAWEILERGLTKTVFENFLDRFPQSRLRYEKSIWDAHTSLYAKRAGLTYTQFLRGRLLGA